MKNYDKKKIIALCSAIRLQARSLREAVKEDDMIRVQRCRDGIVATVQGMYRPENREQEKA